MLSLRPVVRAGLFFLNAFIAAIVLVSRASEAHADDGVILLLVHGDELPRERLRDRIAQELGKPVTLAGSGAPSSGGVVTVTFHPSRHELAVTWDGPKRGTVSRVVSAPKAIDDVVRDAAMLAGNLARDEAEELVAPPPLPTPETETSPPPAEPLPLPAEEHVPATPPSRAEPRAPKEQEDATGGLFYPLATNFGRPWVRTHFDLSLFQSRIGQLDGFQLGGLNVVARAQGRGTGDVNGMQIAWLGNVVTGNVAGFQLASGVNVVSKGVEGWQTATLLNRAGDDVSGLQLAMGLNSAGGTMNGLQLASINVAGDVRGAQIGAINVGRKVKGTMIGLVNVADDVDGVPIGLASVTKTGGVHPQAWASTATIGNLGLKLATKYTYTMPSAHYHHAYGRDFAGAGFTIGGHIPIAENLGPYVDTDLSFAWLYAPQRSAQPLPSGAVDTYHEHLLQPRLRAIFGWRFAEHFGLFAGASLLLQARLLHDGDEAVLRLGPEFVAGVEL
jgi:hypothetical protein